MPAPNPNRNSDTTLNQEHADGGRFNHVFEGFQPSKSAGSLSGSAGKDTHLL